jgi:hypothetical protein
MMAKMNKLHVLLLLLCALFVSAEAMFVKLSDEELIAQSALIVVGELIGRASVGMAADVQTLGVIRVEETLKGEQGVTVAFLALPGGKILRSDNLSYWDGQHGLWYLRDTEQTGIYVADHPQRFVPLDQAGEQIQSLRERLAR